MSAERTLPAVVEFGGVMVPTDAFLAMFPHLRDGLIEAWANHETAPVRAGCVPGDFLDEHCYHWGNGEACCYCGDDADGDGKCAALVDDPDCAPEGHQCTNPMTCGYCTERRSEDAYEQERHG